MGLVVSGQLNCGGRHVERSIAVIWHESKRYVRGMTGVRMTNCAHSRLPILVLAAEISSLTEQPRGLARGLELLLLWQIC